jgi:Mn2+/Fe2+ NRAMP family transporter
VLKVGGDVNAEVGANMESARLRTTSIPTAANSASSLTVLIRKLPRCRPRRRHQRRSPILVPQLLVAVASIAGLAGSAATALILVLPGDVRLWMVISVVSASMLVLWGRYRGVERVATILAVALGLAALAAAVSVGPDLGQLGGGLIPQMPANVDYGEILPWLGFMLSGAAGLIWYSYWVPAKGYDAAPLSRKTDQPVDAGSLDVEERRRLRGWLAQMTLDTTVAVAGTLVVTLAFLVLGTELLRPEGLVPEENRIAEVLGELLGGVWGQAGFWFMVLGVFVGFWDTVLSDQDGFGRMFADGMRRLLGSRWTSGRWADEAFLQRGFLLVLVTALPIALYLTTGEPVALLKVAGAIEAAHIPVVAALTLYLNRRELAPDLRPSWLTTGATLLAALFFAAFAALYVVRLVLPA